MDEARLHLEVRQSDRKPEKRSIEKFLTSAGGAALITVLLGGVAAQVVSCDAQRRAQQREFNNTWLKARGDQALTARKGFVDGRRAALAEIMNVIGRVAAASSDLLDITHPSFTTVGRSAQNSALMLAEQTRVANKFTDAELAWAPAQQRFSYTVGYFSGGDKDVTNAWQNLRSSVNDLRRCMSGVYIRWHNAGRGIGTYTHNPAYCSVQQAKVEANAETLGQKFAKLDTPPWTGWDNPDALKRELHISD